MNKKISIDVLNSISKGADVVESGGINNVQQVKILRKERLGNRKVYRSFSLNLLQEDYIKFLDYLDSNNINSGSALIREILKEKGII
ncbi:hypothetical protein [Helicobacter sp. MIT 14-3879]|uniref:hypothetical protein n=1 Tax=Helicobacter sp. MIT 14-3879 TaxID=2040649 RepID=UPI000E1F5F9A|nr:hypothetical protein [Helicobacter sp. MIT 14-3879]RDU61831.1 hypothetical protein CQA44_07845 [Helicobacter sp. MIT 14-3879]